MKIVSACLAGIDCAYDCKLNTCEKVVELVKKGEALPLCPEQLGGLSTPRPPSEQKGNKVFSIEGKEVTKEFEKGANEILKIAKLVGCKEAILKAKSPSCGSGKVYDGSFSGTLIEGDGILAALLKKNGIKVLTDEEI
tara:strand:- start:1020 stop:1433 length:414 start_codon:yes stop_codon:yes gene_type:complete